MKIRYVYFDELGMAFNGIKANGVESDPSQEPMKSDIITLDNLPSIDSTLRYIQNPFQGDPDLHVMDIKEVEEGGKTIHQISVSPVFIKY